jgi:hypothetical protein
MKGPNTTQIQIEATGNLREGTSDYSLVTSSLRKRSDRIGAVTLCVALSAPRSVSLRQFNKEIPISTIRYHLGNKMGYTLKHCKWVPHKRAYDQKRAREGKSHRPLHLLGSIQCQGWRHVAPLDERHFVFIPKGMER